MLRREGLYSSLLVTCPIRTMYRISQQDGESGERRDQLVHPSYQRPELLATAQPALELEYHQAARSGRYITG